MDKLEKILIKTLKILVCLLAVVIILSIAFFAFLVYAWHDHEKNWYCEEYDISFTSDNMFFPYDDCDSITATVDDYPSQMMIKDDVVYVGDQIIKYEAAGEESFFNLYFKGDCGSSWGKFTVDVTKVYDEEYNYLKGKSLVFKKK